MMNESRSEDAENPIDDSENKNGVFTMGTSVDNSDRYPRVAGNRWSRRDNEADLDEYDATSPFFHNARVRLVVMFNKS